MILSIKTRIYPTKDQKIYFKKAFGIRRFTWNWGLNEYLEAYKNGRYLTNYDLQKQLNNTLVKDPNYSWLSEVNSMVRQESLKDLGLAIKLYHNEQMRARKTSENVDSEKFKPKFKKKHKTEKKCDKSFRMNNKGNPLKVISKKFITLTTTREIKLFKIKVAENLLFLKNYRIAEITIKQEADKFYIIIEYEKTNHNKKCKSQKSKVGIDMGIKNPLTIYNGKKCMISKLPKSLKEAEKKTERFQKKLYQKQIGSNNYNKILIKLQRSYQHENNIKKDFRHKITTKLCRNYHTINIETFSFKAGQNLNINRALYRIGQYNFIELLKYKAEVYGTELNFIPMFTPTTRTCSSCGDKHKVTLKERIYKCPKCGLEIDRDKNAAINIYNYI